MSPHSGAAQGEAGDDAPSSDDRGVASRTAGGDGPERGAHGRGEEEDGEERTARSSCHRAESVSRLWECGEPALAEAAAAVKAAAWSGDVPGAGAEGPFHFEEFSLSRARCAPSEP